MTIIVFQRLKFLNNRMMSQVITLVFLAVWHGWHVGKSLNVSSLII
jgi:hypothetical protein